MFLSERVEHSPLLSNVFIFSILGVKLPKVDSTIRLQFKEYTVITVEPDQDPSVRMLRVLVVNRFSVKLSAVTAAVCYF